MFSRVASAVAAMVALGGAAIGPITNGDHDLGGRGRIPIKGGSERARAKAKRYAVHVASVKAYNARLRNPVTGRPQGSKHVRALLASGHYVWTPGGTVSPKRAA